MGLVRSIGDLFFRLRSRYSHSPAPGEDPDQWLGRRGEHLAVGYLRRHRYKVLYRNFRAPKGGEVDIVCRDKTCDTLVFVEVKTRRSLAFGSPAEAVTREKQILITRGALAWIQMLDDPEILFRFDIVEIVMTGQKVEFSIIKDAFKLPEPTRV
ncbi:MAG: putative endonuclease [Chthoniobacter sp.]|jgi:putative endonuclease|nr:putative endonuclease [Chthoniobacter sp.]